MMGTLELLQWENEHKENNFYEKGEDASQEVEDATQEGE